MTTSPLDAPISECAAMRELRATLARVAASPLPIVLRGPSGSGRRTLARSIAALRHQLTGHTPVHASGIEGLTDSHRKSVSTVWCIEEIERLSPHDQIWIADAIADRGMRLSATSGSSEPLSDRLRSQLAGTDFVVPALAEREGDAGQWLRYMLEQRARELGHPALKLDAAVLDVVHAYQWPGNLAEVHTRALRATAMATGDSIRIGDLGLPEVIDDSKLFAPLAEAVEGFKREYILRALDRCGGNRSRAARLLGVDARTVFRYLEQERPEREADRKETT